MSQANHKKQNPDSDYVMADVLYQRLGNQWYVFTEKDGKVFIGSVEGNVLDSHLERDDQIMPEALSYIAEIETKGHESGR